MAYFLLLSLPKLVSMGLVFWFIFAKTAKRGFLCNDDSIKAHFHGETVSDILLLSVSFLVPIIMVIVVEFNLRKQNNHDERYQFIDMTISAYIAEICHYLSFFVIGFMLNLLMTQIGKDLVGRYRPHFITSCQPIFEDSTNCSDPINIGRFIDSYRCANIELPDFDIDDLRRSWPSGHASISFYSMTFIAVYLFFRKNFMKNYNLIKLSAQLLLLSFAWIAGLSRIGDNKHHCKKILKILIQLQLKFMLI